MIDVLKYIGFGVMLIILGIIGVGVLFFYLGKKLLYPAELAEDDEDDADCVFSDSSLRSE